MRLKSFRVKNFKSIIDSGECSFSEKDNILVLAGQNESGKSAILEALNFFRNGPSANFERLDRRKDTFPEIACLFLLDDEDIEKIYEKTLSYDLDGYFKKNRVVKLIRGNTKEALYEQIYLDDSIYGALDNFFLKEDDKKDVQKLAKVDIEISKPEEKEANEEVKPEIDSTVALDQYIASQIPNFISYTSFDSELPGEITVSKIPEYPAILDFQAVFEVDFVKVVTKSRRAIHRIEQSLNEQASDNLNTYWKQRLDEGGKYNFKVHITSKTPPETSTVEFMIDRDDGDPLYMEHKSKGFRWFSAFNLKLRALGIEKSKIRKNIILIDEPGQGLHEKAQKDVKVVLEELAGKGAQIVYSTHHPNLIGIEGAEFARIRLVSNAKKYGTKVESITQFSSHSRRYSKDTLSPIITAMGLQSIQSLMDESRLNVLVEGISDHYYLSALKKLLGKNDRLYFLPACGVNNVPQLASVLLGWGCKYKAVFDDDPNSGRKAYALLKKKFYEDDDNFIHEHVLKIRDCNGIEDIFCAEDFYEYILDKECPKIITKINSELVKDRKELCSRLFLEKVNNSDVKLKKQTIAKVNEIFNWLKEKFST